MSQLEQQLKRMNEKLQQLVKQYHSLQKENERLKHENQQVTSRFNAAATESEKWQQQSEILKLSREQMNDTERKAFEKRLSQYVKEIDRCIALLNE